MTGSSLAMVSSPVTPQSEAPLPVTAQPPAGHALPYKTRQARTARCWTPWRSRARGRPCRAAGTHRAPAPCTGWTPGSLRSGPGCQGHLQERICMGKAQPLGQCPCFFTSLKSVQASWHPQPGHAHGSRLHQQDPLRTHSVLAPQPGRPACSALGFLILEQRELAAPAELGKDRPRPAGSLLEQLLRRSNTRPASTPTPGRWAPGAVGAEPQGSAPPAAALPAKPRPGRQAAEYQALGPVARRILLLS